MLNRLLWGVRKKEMRECIYTKVLGIKPEASQKNDNFICVYFCSPTTRLAVVCVDDDNDA